MTRSRTLSARPPGTVLLGLLVFLGLAGTVNAATGGWVVTATPITIVQATPTNVVVTATNIKGGSSVGCVRLQIPSAFSVGAAAVDVVTPARPWTADPPTGGSGGSTIVWVHAVTEADVLKNDGESVVFHVRVTGSAGGVYVWPAESRDHASCTSGIDTDSLTVTVAGVAATPTPAPKPTPTPTPAPTPAPTPSPTPKPTPAPTPTPTARPTPTPKLGGANPAPTSTAAAATTSAPAQAVATPDSSPSPLATSTNSASPTPSPSPPAASLPVAGLAAGATSRGPGGPSANGTSGADHLVVGGRAGTDAIDAALVASSLAGLDGIEWAVPTLVLTVPGLLVVLAVMTQIAAGAAWVPIVRRKIGSTGRGSTGARSRSAR